jgi:hypothetical protein
MYSLGKERQIPITCSACHSALMLSLLDFSELVSLHGVICTTRRARFHSQVYELCCQQSTEEDLLTWKKTWFQLGLFYSHPNQNIKTHHVFAFKGVFGHRVFLYFEIIIFFNMKFFLCFQIVLINSH